MATNGIKIIDSDLAHDTYDILMDFYDAGATIEQIVEKFPLTEFQGDDFETEIYTLTCGLAYWEIGLMNSERIEYIQDIIKKGAFINIWTEGLSEIEKQKEREKRNSVLDKFLKKISITNLKIRKRKKYVKIKNFHFLKGDIVSLKIDKNKFAVFLVAKVVQDGSKCFYVAYFFSDLFENDPRIDVIKSKNLFGPDLHLDHSGYNGNFGQEIQNAPIEKQQEIINNYDNFARAKITKDKIQNIIDKIRFEKETTDMLEWLLEHRFITLHRDKFVKIASSEVYSHRVNDFCSFGHFSFDIIDFIFRKDKNFKYRLEYPVDLICKINE